MVKTKGYSVEWSFKAFKELENVILFFTNSNREKFANKLVEKSILESKKLELFSFKGRDVTELKTIANPNVKEILISHWRLIYEIEERARKVYVLRFLDSRRDLKDLLFEDLATT